jgi:shikimate dehydrogenase
MAKFGLVGTNINYSFSKTFFTIKFDLEKIDHKYENFDLESLENFKSLLAENPDLKGLNITIPFKEKIIPLLDRIDKNAKAIGAVNTIKISKDGKLIGYNTDYYGFAKALAEYPQITDKTALILGSGGASKAIQYVLEAMSFNYKIVSRTASASTIAYADLTKEVIEHHKLIINTTPLGVIPNTWQCPDIPYEYLTKNHFLYDLIYNPQETEFLKRGFEKGATVANGMKMLEYQAKKAWSIWKS